MAFAPYFNYFYFKKSYFVILLKLSFTSKIFPLISLYPKDESLRECLSKYLLASFSFENRYIPPASFVELFSVHIFHKSPSSFEISFAKSTNAFENSSQKFHYVENQLVKYMP